MDQRIVALDIGSSSVKAIVAERARDGHLDVLRVLKLPSEGMRKGMVDDFTIVTRTVNGVIGALKEVAFGAVKHIYLGIGSPHVRLQSSRGIVAVSRADLEIYHDDIRRAVEASESIKLPPNRMVIHTLTDEFVVDDITGIKDPLGMVGNRLEARSLIIDAFAPAVKNLVRSIEVAGGGVEGLIFNPLACARAMLTKNQKDLGLVLVDIGFGTTSFAVYQESQLIHAGSIPLGAGHITSDLAIGLKIPILAAESVKFTFGAAVAKEIPIRESIELVKFDTATRGTVSRRFVAEIIEVRLAEILELIHNDLKHFGKAGQLPAGVVFTGGGAKLPYIVDLAKQELRLPACCALPDLAALRVETTDVDIATALDDPEYACALGLLLCGADRSFGRQSSANGFWQYARRLVDYFIP